MIAKIRLLSKLSWGQVLTCDIFVEKGDPPPLTFRAKLQVRQTVSGAGHMSEGFA